MNKNSKEYRRVKGEIDNKLVEIFSWNWHDDPDQCLTDALDEILSIEGLAILADDQTLPENPFAKIADTGDMHAQSRCSGYYCAQIDMGTAGFKKVIWLREGT